MALHCERCGQENTADARFCRHCGAPLAALTSPTLSVDPLIGQHVLGRYEVTALIGEGGMGRVYMAAQRVGTTTRKVAVKTLRAELGADPQLVKRFYREAETIVRLTHPNTIQFFDFGELPDRTLVIVMEYIAGGSLADALRPGPLPAARSDAILSQVCGALYEAHQLGIVHRDLKPDNILLTDRGGRSDFVKVLDFGIAKISAREDEKKPEATRLTQQGMMVGTPPYMSPEQFSGETVDARSDIYSLGVIAYEMLTGRLPFDAKTPWEWASKHLTAEPAPLRVDVQSGISERRVWAIRRALSKAPADRQADVQELLADLTGTNAVPAVASLPPSAKSLPATPAAPTPIHTPRAEPEVETLVGLPRSTSRATWVALALAATGLLGVGAWWIARTPEPAVPKPPPAVAALAVEAPNALAASPVAAPPVGLPHAERTEEDPTLAPRRERSTNAVRHHEHRSPAGESPVAAVPVAPARPPVASNPAATTPAPSRALEALPEPARIPSPAVTPAVTPGAAPAPAPPVESVPKDLSDRVKRGLQMTAEKPEVAVGLLQGAASKYGSDHPALVPWKRALSARGPARVREMVSGGRCGQAQALFRAMRAAGLMSAAGSLFDRSCAVPP